MNFPETPVPVDSVSPQTLKDRLDDGESVVLLDTRPPEMYEEWHISEPSVTRINIPHTSFHPELDESVLAQLPTDRPIVTVCAIGKSSEYIAGLLKERGYDVAHLADGMHGWARIYERYELTQYAGSGTVYQYQRPSSGCLAYLIVDGGEAAVIDPLRAFADRYLADATALGVELKYAIDTHVHADHISGLRELVSAGVTGVMSEPAVARGVRYDETLTVARDGDIFSVGDVEIETVYTPGHTSGMTSFLVDGEVLLTGDGLFIESVARPDLEDGDAGAPEAANQLHQSLHERILTLPNSTLVGGAHHSDAAPVADDGTYTATLGEIHSRMPALSMEREEFVEYVLADMPARPANYLDIIATNLGEKETGDEEAFELELGPNNCAATPDATAD